MVENSLLFNYDLFIRIVNIGCLYVTVGGLTIIILSFLKSRSWTASGCLFVVQIPSIEPSALLKRENWKYSLRPLSTHMYIYNKRCLCCVLECLIIPFSWLFPIISLTPFSGTETHPQTRNASCQLVVLLPWFNNTKINVTYHWINVNQFSFNVHPWSQLAYRVVMSN